MPTALRGHASDRRFHPHRRSDGSTHAHAKPWAWHTDARRTQGEPGGRRQRETDGQPRPLRRADGEEPRRPDGPARSQRDRSPRRHAASPSAPRRPGRRIDSRADAERAPAATRPRPPARQPTSAAAAPAKPGNKLAEIKSETVGTFYTRPSPDAPPFVTVGSKVTPTTVVCTVEAMKTYSPVEAGISGTIVEICAQDGLPVEFNQVLFRVEV